MQLKSCLPASSYVQAGKRQKGEPGRANSEVQVPHHISDDRAEETRAGENQKKKTGTFIGPSKMPDQNKHTQRMRIERHAGRNSHDMPVHTNTSMNLFCPNATVGKLATSAANRTERSEIRHRASKVHGEAERGAGPAVCGRGAATRGAAPWRLKRKRRREEPGSAARLLHWRREAARSRGARRENPSARSSSPARGCVRRAVR
jgi:hypothetical protein